jgi:hypothetical protein
MEYTYYDIKADEEITKTITDIPKYGNDINQIIMLDV